MVDVTEVLFNSLAQITDNKVVSHKLYELFEGTRAVEVGYDKLDTYMIRDTLTELEIHFDVTKEQLLEAVLGIMDKLVCLSMSWLSNSSLPITVLSCRYVQSILQNHLDGGVGIDPIDFCRFTNAKSKPTGNCSHNKNANYKNVHVYLRAFIIVLSKFIDLCITLCTGFLYDEEDFTSRALDFSFLRQVPNEDVWGLLQEVKNESNLNVELQKRFEFVELLFKMNDLLANSRIQVFQSPTNPKFFDLLNESEAIITKLQSSFFKYESSIPEGAFSKFVQMDLSNSSIPADLTMLDASDCIMKYRCLFKDLENLLHLSTKISNCYQMDCFLKYEVGAKAQLFNVFVRAFFLSVFLRDNVHLYESAVTVKDVMKMEIDALCGRDSTIFQPDTWSVNVTTKQEIEVEFDELFHNIETSIFHKLTRPTNNRCRQRQLANKCLLIWDTLQVSTESLEMKLWSNYKIGDEIVDQEPGLPLSSYIYFNKLEEMIGILLRGFELDLYKYFEFCQIYWYVAYLSKLVLDHLKNRVQAQIRGRIHAATVGLAKKVKKLKAGEKKQQLKELQKYKQEVIVPQLNQCLLYNENYLTAKYTALNKLCDGIKYYMVLLDCVGLLKRFSGKKPILASMEAIYNLRMKPFSTIGVPSLPTYEQYRASIQFPNATKEKLLLLFLMSCSHFKQAKEMYNDIGRFVCENGNLFLGEEVELWFQKLGDVCDGYLKESCTLERLIRSGDSQGYIVDFSNVEDGHVYFPRVKIVKKQ